MSESTQRLVFLLVALVAISIMLVSSNGCQQDREFKLRMGEAGMCRRPGDMSSIYEPCPQIIHTEVR